MIRALIIAITAILWLASVSAVGIASDQVGRHLPLMIGLAIDGYPADRLAFVTLGVTISFLKTGLVIEGVRRRGQSRAIGWLICGMVLVCVAYTWSVLMWAFVMITPLAGQPVLTIVLAMGAAALLEIAATVLPAIALAPASSAPHVAAPTSDSATPREHTPSASNPASPRQPHDLLGLLTSVATTGTPPDGSKHLQRTDDGSIETTQAALAKVLGCSKSSINRRLCALEKSMRLRVSTSVHGTRITHIGTQ